MATINFTGRLTKDIKVSNGWSNFTVAEEKRFKPNNDQSANFFTCKAKLSEAQENSLKKGSKVEIIGNFDFETYEKNGVKYYNHSVYVYHLNFVSDTKKRSNNKETLEEVPW